LTVLAVLLPLAFAHLAAAAVAAGTIKPAVVANPMCKFFR
jgi:hypothetical protein